MRKFYLLKFCLLVWVMVITAQCCYPQSYGLGFYSHEVDQDKRTSLDLSPQKSFCFKNAFDISFDLSFIPGHPTYFGYILRIVEDDKRNFDLVYDNEADKFNFVIGERFSKISFKISKEVLYDHWTRIRIQFDPDHDQVILYAGGKAFVEKGLQLKSDNCYKMLFGANSHPQFGTTDLPPMKLRAIDITEKGVLKYSWLLNEKIGSIAPEQVAQNDGAVKNPMWIRAQHYSWKLSGSFTAKGAASVAFNSADEELYIVGSDSVYRYNAKGLKWASSAYATGNQNLNIGSQSVFCNYDKKLYNVFTDSQYVAALNVKNYNWSKRPILAPITNFLLVNKFISPADSSLYVIGGYGHHEYKNMTQQYHFNTGIWERIKTKGDFFTPRYLAALGTTRLGDTAYILGGYGSVSGQQVLNPKNLYDLMRFSVRDHSFKKMFSLNITTKDFALANSLVIDDQKKEYYGLVYPERKFESNLQLIKGSLRDNSYQLVGNSIPFLFNDLRSFADLYYCPASKKFIAVTLLRMENKLETEIKVYTLLGPPEAFEPEATTHAEVITWIWLCLVISVVSGMLVYYYIKRRKFLQNQTTFTAPTVTITKVEPVEEAMIVNEKVLALTVQPSKASIYLFGELQLITANGHEIVNAFTPLTKELFLYLFIHSIKRGRGVSAEKLNEILWFDKDEKSARNNRSVNIAKLKIVLDQMGNCSVSRETGYWKIDFDNKLLHVDYYAYLTIVSDKTKLDKQKIICLSEIVQRGNFLSNCEYEWLDQHKSEISNEIIDTYLKFAGYGKIQDDPEFLIKIANYIFNIDPVNEEAMLLKCKALVFLGKHSLAKSTFENFRREYKGIYAEEFKKDFAAVLSEELR